MDDYSRRAFIRTSLPGFLGLTMALPSITAIATRANACSGRIPEDGAIHWDAFLEAIAREAGRQHLDDWNEAGYVARAAEIPGKSYVIGGNVTFVWNPSPSNNADDNVTGYRLVIRTRRRRQHGVQPERRQRHKLSVRRKHRPEAPCVRDSGQRRRRGGRARRGQLVGRTG